MDRELLKDTAFAQDDSIYNKQIKTVPTPGIEIGIDLDNTVLQNIAQSAEGFNSFFDTGAVQNFTTISRNRNEIYQTLDYMAEDSTIAAILETYAEDATEANDSGDIVWVESNDADAAQFITYLLSSMNVNKHVYDWTHSLCKYGDLYVRLYRESDYDDFLFNVDDTEEQVEESEVKSLHEDIDNNKEAKPLNEDIKIKVYGKNDKYVHYAEKVDNPAQMFEITKFGKTAAYIQTDVQATVDSSDQIVGLNSFLNTYKFNKNDVHIYQPTEFVHASLQDNTSRVSEEIELFITNNDDQTSQNKKYKVRRGQSLLYSSYKVWRQLQLLENSVLLNRITQSSIVRMIGVEVGDMPKEAVGPHLAGIKQLVEQKTALEVGKSLSEYTNPGPIINNIYVPIRKGQGAITTSQIGGDVDVKGLADLDYYQDKFFGCLHRDSKIKFADGSIENIKQVYENINNYLGKEIYSCNIDGSKELGILAGVFETDIKQKFIEFELEDGSVIKVTPEHKMMLSDGTFKLAKELTEDDELMI